MTRLTESPRWDRFIEQNRGGELRLTDELRSQVRAGLEAAGLPADEVEAELRDLERVFNHHQGQGLRNDNRIYDGQRQFEALHGVETSEVESGELGRLWAWVDDFDTNGDYDSLQGRAGLGAGGALRPPTQRSELPAYLSQVMDRHVRDDVTLAEAEFVRWAEGRGINLANLTDTQRSALEVAEALEMLQENPDGLSRAQAARLFRIIEGPRDWDGRGDSAALAFRSRDADGQAELTPVGEAVLALRAALAESERGDPEAIAELAAEVSAPEPAADRPRPPPADTEPEPDAAPAALPEDPALEAADAPAPEDSAPDAAAAPVVDNAAPVADETDEPAQEAAPAPAGEPDTVEPPPAADAAPAPVETDDDGVAEEGPPAATAEVAAGEPGDDVAEAEPSAPVSAVRQTLASEEFDVDLSRAEIFARTGMERLGVDVRALDEDTEFWSSLAAVEGSYRERNGDDLPVSREEILPLAGADGIISGEEWLGADAESGLLAFVEEHIDFNSASSTRLNEDGRLTASGEVLARFLERAEGVRTGASFAEDAGGAHFLTRDFDGSGLSLQPGAEARIRGESLVSAERAFELATAAIHGEPRDVVMESDAAVNAVLERFTEVPADQLDETRREIYGDLPWAQRFTMPQFAGDLTPERLVELLPELTTEGEGVDVASQSDAFWQALSEIEVPRWRDGPITREEIEELTEQGFLRGTAAAQRLVDFAEAEVDTNGSGASLAVQDSDGSLTPTGQFLASFLDRAGTLDTRDAATLLAERGLEDTHFDSTRTDLEGLDFEVDAAARTRLDYAGVMNGEEMFGRATELVYGRSRSEVRSDDERVNAVIERFIGARVAAGELDAARARVEAELGWSYRFIEDGLDGRLSSEAVLERFPELPNLGLRADGVPAELVETLDVGNRERLQARMGRGGIIGGHEWIELTAAYDGEDGVSLHNDGVPTPSGRFLATFLDNARPIRTSDGFVAEQGDHHFYVAQAVDALGLSGDNADLLRNSGVVDAERAFALATRLVNGEATDRFFLDDADAIDSVLNAFGEQRVAAEDVPALRQEIYESLPWDQRLMDARFGELLTPEQARERMPELDRLALDVRSISENDAFWSELASIPGMWRYQRSRDNGPVTREMVLEWAGEDGLIMGPEWGGTSEVSGLLNFAEIDVDYNRNDGQMSIQDDGALSETGLFLAHMLGRAVPVLDAESFSEDTDHSLYDLRGLNFAALDLHEGEGEHLRSLGLIHGQRAFDLITQIAHGSSAERVLDPGNDPDFQRVRDVFAATAVPHSEAAAIRREIFGDEYGRFPAWAVERESVLGADQSTPLSTPIEPLVELLTTPDENGDSVLLHTRVAASEGEPGITPEDAAYLNTLVPGVALEDIQAIAAQSEPPDFVLSTEQDFRALLGRLADPETGEVSLRDEDGITPVGELLSVVMAYRGQLVTREAYAAEHRDSRFYFGTMANAGIRRQVSNLTGIGEDTLATWANQGLSLGFDTLGETGEHPITTVMVAAADRLDNSGDEWGLISRFGRGDEVRATEQGRALASLEAAFMMSNQDYSRMVFANLPEEVREALPAGALEQGIPDGTLYRRYGRYYTWDDVSVETSHSSDNLPPPDSTQERNLRLLEPLVFANMHYMESIVGGEVFLTSVYRDSDVARAVGSVPGSAHTQHATGHDITSNHGGWIGRERTESAIRNQYGRRWLLDGYDGIWNHDGHVHIGFQDIRELPIRMPATQQIEIMERLRVLATGGRGGADPAP